MEHGTPASPVESIVQWLEEEQRQNKAVLFRMQQQMEQMQNTLWGLGERLNVIEGSLSGVMGHAARVAHIEEEARQTKELAERLQTALNSLAQSTEAEGRARQTDLERERLSRAEITQKIDTIERVQEGLQERIVSQEDANRKTQQELFRLASEFDPLRAQDERLTSHLTALQAQTKRHETEVAELQQEGRSLQAQDEVLQGRLLNLTDQVRRLESNAELAELESRVMAALNEQAELARMERQRMERMAADIELGYGQSRTNIEDLQQAAAQLSGRLQAMGDHLEHLRQQIWDLRTDLSQALGGVAATQEQHYRRALAELELQLRELSQWRIAPPRT